MALCERGVVYERVSNPFSVGIVSLHDWRVSLEMRGLRLARIGLDVGIAAVIVGVAASPVAGASPVGIADISAVAMAHGALGVYLDSSGSTVVVVPSAQMASQAASDMAPPGASVRIQTTDLAVSAEQQMHDDLVAMSPQATASYAIYFDLKTAKMVIQTKGTGEEFAGIAAKYRGHVEIQPGAKGGLTAAPNRMADTPPYWGGAYANPPGGNLCTTGFTAHNGGYYYMATAGHCYSQGTNVYNSQTGAWLGYVSAQEYPAWDIEWIYGASYGAHIYNGTVTSSGWPSGTRVANDSSYANVYGRKYAWVGQTGYCATGWRSGRVCDWNVASTSADFYNKDNGLWTHNLYAYSGTKEIEGNSGGPVYYPYNGGALIAGTIVGYYDIGFGNTNYSTKAAESLAHWNLEVACIGTCVIQP